jgi:hypothetical protein
MMMMMMLRQASCYEVRKSNKVSKAFQETRQDVGLFQRGEKRKEKRKEKIVELIAREKDQASISPSSLKGRKVRIGLEDVFSCPTGAMALAVRLAVFSTTSLFCKDRIADPVTLMRFSLTSGGELDSHEPGLTADRIEAFIRSCDAE